MRRLGPFSLVMLLLVLHLSACYRHEHSTRQHGTLGYQFDEPREYCRHFATDSGFEMYCPEGKIVVEFVAPSSGVTSDDLFADLLNRMPDSSKYSLSELDGNISRIDLAEFEDEIPIQENHPIYIAVFPFDANHIVIAQGFLYKSEFRDQFRPAFRTLIETLKPYPEER